MRANKMSGTQKGERKEMNEMKGSLRKKEIDNENKRKKKRKKEKKKKRKKKKYTTIGHEAQNIKIKKLTKG